MRSVQFGIFFLLVLFSQAQEGFVISGKVNTSAVVFPQDTAWVRLFGHDTLSGQLLHKESVLTFDGNYQFENVKPGTYLLWSGLVMGSNYFYAYLPTYQGSGLFWEEAISIVVTQSDIQVADINLIEGQIVFGEGTIKGTLVHGPGPLTGEPIPNATVLCLKNGEQPITHRITDEKGEFEFTNLPWGDYKISIEIPGKLSSPISVKLNGAHPIAQDLTFELGETEIQTALETANVSQFRVFPNPVRDILSVEMQLTQSDALDIYLINIQGQSTKLKSMEAQPGDQLIEIELPKLNKGIYLLDIRGRAERMSQRIQLN